MSQSLYFSNYSPFTNEGQIWCWVFYSRPKVYAYVPHLFSIDLFCRTLLVKNPIFAVFGLPHLVVSPVGSSLRKLDISAQIVSVLQRLHGEIGRTISDVQKRDGQTDRQTDRQKTQRFWPRRRRVKSEPH